MKKKFLNNISKIFVSSVFVASVAFSALGVDVFAERKKTETHELNDDISYTYKDVDMNGKFDTLIIFGDGPMPEYSGTVYPWNSERHNIKEVIIEDGVKSIGEDAFYQFEYLRDVTIPDSVKFIGEGAFYKCGRLESVILPDSIRSIESNTFGGCYTIKSITIPANVTEIKGSAFTYCSDLETIKFLGDDLEIIGMMAFGGCGFKELVIPDGVEIIKEGAFMDCRELKKVTIPESVEKIESTAFDNCPAIREVRFECSSSLEYDSKWGFDEKYFIKEHNYKNGRCTVCYEKEDGKTYANWDEIIENTGVTFGTSTYNVDLDPRDTVVPYAVFSVLKGENAVLNIKVDDTFSWSINGKDIKSPKKLDLGVKIADKSIPLALVDDYTKDFNYTEIELSGSGDFGLEAKLTIDVGTINNQKKVDLYYYDGSDLEFIATSEVKSGKVTLPFTHASKYVIDIYNEKAAETTTTTTIVDDFVIKDFAAGENVIVKEIIL
ncbi:MAG: leucine-rich repeat domain-containing protein [Oscillospiraceae bacterium]|nr:leucine-rich repeat domain-containing protein [Oscillospiraceae bacterium]MBR4093541.1 leucine-rich repeat domain-containing protein [Oscillospiraceae bacterium]